VKKPIRKEIPSKNNVLDRMPKNRGEYLELLIKITERAITLSSVGGSMEKQVKRLKLELSDWKAANSPF